LLEGEPIVLFNVFSWNILGGKARPARKADNLTAIFEPIV
jgi:hypothetical protein